MMMIFLFCKQGPPLVISPLRAIYDPEEKIPDEPTSQRVHLDISSESSDSTDLEIHDTPVKQPRSNTASGRTPAAATANISTRMPKVIPRVEIVEYQDADPRFRHIFNKVKKVAEDKAEHKQDDKATATQNLGQANKQPAKEAKKQDDGPKVMKGPSTRIPPSKPQSRKDISALEKEDPVGALDCLIAEILNSPCEAFSTSHSMPENAAKDFLQGLKEASFEQDLFKALEEDASLYHEIMTSMRRVQGIRADSDMGRYLGEFDFMLQD